MHSTNITPSLKILSRYLNIIHLFSSTCWIIMHLSTSKMIIKRVNNFQANFPSQHKNSIL